MFLNITRSKIPSSASIGALKNTLTPTKASSPLGYVVHKKKYMYLNMANEKNS